ncbi:nicotinate-nucleotide adenylyltransferase [Candidatus Gillettellia adelgis]
MVNHPIDVTMLHALFGGTFDPIHYGHLRPVESLVEKVGLRRITLLPNHMPPYRSPPKATAQQRLKMIELAITDHPLFMVDDREMQRTIPSYTVRTLEAVRQECGASPPLAFIIGQDSLVKLHTWKNWKSLLDLCHLLVLARIDDNNYLDIPELQRWLKRHCVTDTRLLNLQPHGHIYFADTPVLKISATQIRQRQHLGLNCDNLLPRSVQRYIELQGLYR